MKDNSVNALILNITEVVLHTHFYWVTDEDTRKDLVQEGYLKAYELLSSGNYDPYRNLRTFIYTGVRNAMTNYMYHFKKESHETLDVVEDAAWQDYKQVINDSYYESKVYYHDKVEITYKLQLEDIMKVVNKYKMFGDYTQDVISYFVDLGIYDGTSNNTKKSEEEQFILDAIEGEILWNFFDKPYLKE